MLVVADVDHGGVGEAEQIDVAPRVLQDVGQRPLLRTGPELLLGQRARDLVADLVARQEEAGLGVRADLGADIAVEARQVLVGVLAEAVGAEVGEGHPGIPRPLGEARRDLLAQRIVAAAVEAGGEAGIAAAGRRDEVDGAAQGRRAVAQRVGALVDLDILLGERVDLVEVAAAVGLVDRRAVLQEPHAAQVEVARQAGAADDELGILLAVLALDADARRVVEHVLHGGGAAVEVALGRHDLDAARRLVDLLLARRLAEAR